MFNTKSKWSGFGTLEYRNKKSQLLIVDRFLSPHKKRLSFDVNIFNNESDAHVFTELFVVPEKLYSIISLYEFDKNIINKICDKTNQTG